MIEAHPHGLQRDPGVCIRAPGRNTQGMEVEMIRQGVVVVLRLRLVCLMFVVRMGVMSILEGLFMGRRMLMGTMGMGHELA